MAPQSGATNTSFFRAPKPIRVLFEAFPLYTHPIDCLPMTAGDMRPTTTKPRTDTFSAQPTLYLFGPPGYSESCPPSFNPTCLKWQTYLKIRGVEFRTESSNNHASPSGSLPFLVVESKKNASTERPTSKTVPSSKIAQWIEENADGSVSGLDLESPDYRAFTSLIDTNIRQIWLYALYVEPANLNKITVPNYTHPTPFWPISSILGSQMRDAALESISRGNEDLKITGNSLYSKSKTSWAALSTLLGSDEWFFGERDAGLFDATVFAYTHLILNTDLSGVGKLLSESLREHRNLVEHEDRIRRRHYQ